MVFQVPRGSWLENQHSGLRAAGTEHDGGLGLSGRRPPGETSWEMGETDLNMGIIQHKGLLVRVTETQDRPLPRSSQCSSQGVWGEALPVKGELWVLLFLILSPGWPEKSLGAE